MFHLEPVGAHTVEVCTNVCVRRSSTRRQVLEAFERELGIGPGETTEDGEVTLRAVECLGGCADADDRRRRPPLPRSRSRRTTSPAIVEELRMAETTVASPRPRSSSTGTTASR